jgi:L-alanine-DL-glutamate epimerase-like enolase superfamily enzyme
MTPTVDVSAVSKFRLSIRVDDWPLNEPFIITGHRFEVSSIIMVTITDGVHAGRGEASGVYYRGETPDRLISMIEEVRLRIEAGITRDELQGILPPGGARNALDCALWDLEAARSGEPVWSLAGLPGSHPLLTTWTIGAASPERMAARAREYQAIRALKLKLLGDGADGERVRAVRRERPDVWIGVDANQGFTPDTLDAVWPTLLECGVKLIEQPFPIGKDAWLSTRERTIPFAADESLQSLADLDRVGELYDVINIKLDKCGGLTEAFAVARQARDMGLKVMVGNMTGTSLGMAPALVLGQLCEVVDLDGPIFLSRDYVPGVHYADGRIGIRQSFWGRVTTTAEGPSN